MQEYIFYVVLVFFPIGAVMAYLLRKESLPWRYILTIEVVSLLIIISFPISMGKLGAFLSFIIYITFLVFLVGYFFHGQKNSAVINEQSSDTSILSNEEQGQIKNTSEGLTAKDVTALEPETYTVVTAEEGVNKDGTTSSLKEQMSISSSFAAGENNEELNKVALKNDGIKDNVVNETEMVTDNTDNEEKDNIEEIDPIAIPFSIMDHGSEHKAKPETMDILTDITVDEGFNEDDTEEIATSEIIAEETGAIVTEVDDQLEEYVKSEEEPKNPDATAESEETAVNNGAGDDDKRLSMLIDSGFSKRNENLQEAGEFFVQAWCLTSDIELKYLLTAELSHIYKESGQYSKAEDILRQFAVSIDERPDIIKEIHRQLTEVRLLVTELTRLGLGDIPLSAIPRWIRLKVDEEMTTQEDNRRRE